MDRAIYSPPWVDTSIIGIAGSSCSGKTSFAVETVSSLDRPWVVILSMDSFYKPLDAQDLEKAFRNEYDLDVPDAIDFDLLVSVLQDLKQGKRVEVPNYSFEKNARLDKTTSVYSPHVIILEGIYALHDPRIKALLDLKIFTDADTDTCLARRLTRDVRQRGRDIEGIIKQWFAFVKPNFERHVKPQREIADIIIPRGIENEVAMAMVVAHIQRILDEKSRLHRAGLKKLGLTMADEPISKNVLLIPQTSQVVGMATIIQDRDTSREDFIFYFDRLSTLLVERAMNNMRFTDATITTPLGLPYNGLHHVGEVSAVVILRSGATLETGLRRVIPDCRTGRLLIQSNYRTGEPELHYQHLPSDIATHDGVLLLGPEMMSGGAALMAVKVLVDHGVAERNIVFVTYFATKAGLNRLCKVFPEIKVVACRVIDEHEERWIATKYFGC